MSNYCAVCGKKLGILESGATLDNNQSEFKICMDCKTKEERLVVEREEKDFGYMHAARKWFNNCLEQGRVEDGAVETVKRLIRESEKSETDNLEFHNNRSAQVNNLMMTTGYNFEGYRILEYKSVLSGEVVLGTGFFSEVDAGVSDVLGISSSAMEGKLYIQTGKTKDVAKQIAVNPKVEICAMSGDEWIRLSGTLAEDDRVEAQESMLDAYPSLRNMYTTGSEGNTAVFYFTEGTATISSFSHAPEVIQL